MLLKDEVDVFVVIGAGDDVVLIFIFKKKMSTKSLKKSGKHEKSRK